MSLPRRMTGIGRPQIASPLPQGRRLRINDDRRVRPSQNFRFGAGCTLIVARAAL
jgi:hypothetical protein